jgi:DNA-binding NarL/FixJ family response regulator
MRSALDVLIIDPLDKDARQTSAAIRRKVPDATTIRVPGGEQASRLMFERGLLTQEPQVPELIIVDLAAAGDCAKSTLRQLKTRRMSDAVPVVVFSGRRSAKDLLEAHLLGVHMNVLKPADPNDYALAVERMMTMWLAGSFMWRSEAS